MDIQTRKIKFVQKFLKLKNEETITVLENILQENQTELIDTELQAMNLKQFQEEINQAIKDSENDNGIEATELKEKINGWS